MSKKEWTIYLSNGKQTTVSATCERNARKEAIRQLNLIHITLIKAK